MKEPSLVTVVCLCYNHENFIKEALDSILDQTYKRVEVILIDDYSTDNSLNILTEYSYKYNWELIVNVKNKGNCKSFNKGLARARGEFIIDFATDDILLPTRIEEQVNIFQKLLN